MAKNLSSLRNKNRSRPRKGASEKLRRLKVQKNRLVKMGMSAESVARLDFDQVRELLRLPAVLKKKLSAK